MPRIVRLDLPAPAHPARSFVDRRERVRALVRARPDHDHMTVPFVWLTPNEADLRRTTVTQGESHASIKSRRRSSDGGGRTSFTGQAKAVDTAVESQPAASPRTYRSGRTSPPRQPHDFDSDSSLGAVIRARGSLPPIARSRSLATLGMV